MTLERIWGSIPSPELITKFKNVLRYLLEIFGKHEHISTREFNQSEGLYVLTYSMYLQYILTVCSDHWKVQRLLQVIHSIKYEDISFQMIAVIWKDHLPDVTAHTYTLIHVSKTYNTLQVNVNFLSIISRSIICY
jgi:hypothetical protein